MRLGARWNRLVEPVKTRKERGKAGGKWARYRLKGVGAQAEGIAKLEAALAAVQAEGHR